jgi:hypothetical protein
MPDGADGDYYTTRQTSMAISASVRLREICALRHTSAQGYLSMLRIVRMMRRVKYFFKRRDNSPNRIRASLPSGQFTRSAPYDTLPNLKDMRGSSELDLR